MADIQISTDRDLPAPMRDDLLYRIEIAIEGWCDFTGWTMTRQAGQITLRAPECDEGAEGGGDG